MERTTLYRYFDADDRLLYVGISGQPVGRQEAHRRGAPWWHRAARQTLTHYATRADALLAEATAIEEERPVYNLWRPATVERQRRHLRALRLWQHRHHWQHRQAMRAAARAAQEAAALVLARQVAGQAGAVLYADLDDDDRALLDALWRAGGRVPASR